MSVLEGAVEKYEAAPDRNFNLVRAYAALAQAQQRSGDAASARRSADRAVDLARKAAAGFESSEWLGGALLAQATVLAAQGFRAAGQAALTESRKHLAGSAGARSPLLLRAEALAKDL